MKKLLILASLVISTNVFAKNITCSLLDTEDLKRFEFSADLTGNTLSAVTIYMVEGRKKHRVESEISIEETEGVAKVYPAGTLDEEMVTSYTFKPNHPLVSSIQLTPGFNNIFNSRIILKNWKQFVSFCQ